MARPHGTPKTGGRKKGTPNKRTAHLVEALDFAGLNVPDALTTLLPNLAPEKQADILMGLLGYLYPKRKAIELVEKTEAKPIDPTDQMSKEELCKVLYGSCVDLIESSDDSEGMKAQLADLLRSAGVFPPTPSKEELREIMQKLENDC